jgi:hypothetical protein
MEYLVVIGIIVFLYLAYTRQKSSNWNQQYRIALGSYFGLTPEQSKNENNFDGTCTFKENPIITNIRFAKGEKVFAAFHNLSLMVHKRDGGIGAYGITVRKKVMPGVFLRGGIGKIGMSKSWQSETVGSLYITNIGIVYDGQTKNIKLPWEKIMRENIMDGEIQIEKANGQPIILQGTVEPKEAAKFTVVSRMHQSL